MAKLSPHDMADKLAADGFERSGPQAETLSDPVGDTPMVVTLDELRPYELDPRITRNPLYDEIKSSIHERGLDAPPPITRRPGSDHFIIRNGGNTRLAILRELWSETKDERFFRIVCLFRPWPERGEIIALTGHLAENELHGGLSFIERALGVEKARELYEQGGDGKPLSQSELARRLKADGYPVLQPHISRMQEAIQYLLPAIPNLLYAGLGRHQVEQLTSLRRSSARVWDARAATNPTGSDFASLFQDVLAGFDGQPSSFSAERVQDELIGQMADLFATEYDTLAFEIGDAEGRWQRLSRDPGASAAVKQPAQTPPYSPSARHLPEPSIPSYASSAPPASSGPAEPPATKAPDPEDDDLKQSALLDAHIVSPAATTDRLQSIQRLVADTTGDTPPDFERNVLQAIPVQAGGLYPISDVWYIEPALNDPDRLRTHIAQFAHEIAGEVGLKNSIIATDHGIGFTCEHGDKDARRGVTTSAPCGVLTLLHALSAPHQSPSNERANTEPFPPGVELGTVLLGQTTGTEAPSGRLSDSGLVKLFRLIRLGRRLLDIEADVADVDDAAPVP